MYLPKSLQYFSHAVFSAFAISLLLSCTVSKEGKLIDKVDLRRELSRETYRDTLIPTDNKPSSERGDMEEVEIPEAAGILTAPPKPATTSGKRVSISVTEDVPIKDVLIELANRADVDVEVDPAITGGIIFRAKNKPFDVVVARITELAGLRYHMADGILRVEKDTPYPENYYVDFLNLNRSSNGNVSIDTKVLGGGGTVESASEGLSSGSTNAITASYDGDLWTSLEQTLKAILNYTPRNLSAPIQGASSVIFPENADASISINRQAGVISVIASQRQHVNVKKYLDTVRESMSAQVLIEAKILEITLDEEFKSGIDWGILADNNLGLAISGEFNPVIADTNFFKISGGGQDNLNTAVSLTESFGVSRTLSSPRLHAMNNQQAVLTFAENRVYFTIEVEEETQEGDGTNTDTTLTIDSTLNTVPIGVILTLQPSINLATKEITMNIRPTLSRITGTVNDPAVDLIVARQTGNNPIDVTSEIPVIEVREMDSVLKIANGEIMVIGGLMREINSNQDRGIPYASRVPFLGNLFKSVEKNTEVVETIIFIKATIVPSKGSKVAKGDKDIYNTFVNDPRPLAF